MGRVIDRSFVQLGAMYYYTGCASDTEKKRESKERERDRERKRESEKKQSQVPLLLQHSAALNSAKRRETPRPASSFPNQPLLTSSSCSFHTEWWLF